jgi:hypothetical protein
MNPYVQIEDATLDEENHNLINNTSFTVTFHYGYGFRMLMDFVKTIDPECEIIFDRQSIRFSKSDTEKKIMVDVLIAGEELVEYSYNSPEDEYIMFLKLSVFFQNIKQASKKKTIRMFKNSDSKESFFQILESYKEKSAEKKEIPTLNMQSPKIITPPPEKYYIEDPIAVIPMNSFSADCKDYSNNQYDSVDICISKNLVKTIGKYNDDNIEKDNLKIKPYPKRYYSDLYSDISDEERNSMDDQNMYVVNIPIHRIKSFTKLAIASENGVIKFYRPTDDIIKISKEKEKVVPIKLMCTLNNYGIVQIYLS